MSTQYVFIVSGLMAIFLNLCIIVLHFHPQKTHRNSYDRLILIFAVLDIIFAILHSLLLPVFIYEDDKIALLSVGIFCCFNFSQILLNLLYIIYLSFIALVLHSFVYRFVYLCKSSLLHVLQRLEYDIFSCICPLIIASPFIIIGNLKFGPKTYISRALDVPSISELYNVDIYTAAYFAKIIGADENDAAYGILILVELSVVAVVVVIICAWCTLLITGKLHKQVLSHRAKRMHRRMLKLLVMQSLLPLVTLYAPVLFYITSLFFRIPVSSNSSFVLALLLSLFPSLDAMLVSFFVRDYRPFTKREIRRGSHFAAVAHAATLYIFLEEKYRESHSGRRLQSFLHTLACVFIVF